MNEQWFDVALLLTHRVVLAWILEKSQEIRVAFRPEGKLW